jgi:hypothetical protein
MRPAGWDRCQTGPTRLISNDLYHVVKKGSSDPFLARRRVQRRDLTRNVCGHLQCLDGRPALYLGIR